MKDLTKAKLEPDSPFVILANDTQHNNIHYSCVHTAEDSKTINICADKWGENYEFINTHIDAKTNNEDFLPEISSTCANKWKRESRES